MSIRSDHRTQLKTLLEQAQFEGKNLIVSEYYINTSDEYPYIYITASSIIPNKGGSSVMSTFLNYNMVYKYFVNVVFTAPNEFSDFIEQIIDGYEEVILNKLQSSSMRNAGLWQDLLVTDVSPTYERDPEINDNSIMKSFEVSIEQVVNNPV